MPVAIFDCTGKRCFICFDEFNNGDDAVVVCGNDHALCMGCADSWDFTHPLVCRCATSKGERLTVESILDGTGIVSFRHYEPGSCPVCRESVTLISIEKCQNYYAGSGSESSPITVDD